MSVNKYGLYVVQERVHCVVLNAAVHLLFPINGKEFHQLVDPSLLIKDFHLSNRTVDSSEVRCDALCLNGRRRRRGCIWYSFLNALICCDRDRNIFDCSSNAMTRLLVS